MTVPIFANIPMYMVAQETRRKARGQATVFLCPNCPNVHVEILTNDGFGIFAFFDVDSAAALGQLLINPPAAQEEELKS